MKIATKLIGALAEHHPRQFPIMKAAIEGFEGLPLDFDDAAFYRRFDSFSKSRRQMREEGRNRGAILRG
jgi:hypothetical protein